MKDFERRIAELERKAGVGEDRISVIVRSFYRPGQHGPERCAPVAYQCVGSDWRVERDVGESDDSFEQRAINQVPRKPGSMAVLREVLA